MDIPSVGSQWQHWKGTCYKVLANARHSETHEPMVVYAKDEPDADVWVRPLSMWGDEIRPGIIRFMRRPEPVVHDDHSEDAARSCSPPGRVEDHPSPAPAGGPQDPYERAIESYRSGRQ